VLAAAVDGARCPFVCRWRDDIAGLRWSTRGRSGSRTYDDLPRTWQPPTVLDLDAEVSHLDGLGNVLLIVVEQDPTRCSSRDRSSTHLDVRPSTLNTYWQDGLAFYAASTDSLPLSPTGQGSTW
jgi:hypothetical protein